MIKFLIILICLTSICCSSSKEKPTKSIAPLENTRWVLKVMNDRKVFTPEGGKEIYIQFQTKDNRINGFAGCNNFFGTYTSKSNQLKFGEIGATEMFCEQQMSTEKQFLKALELTVRYRIEGNNLYFSDAAHTLVKFEASYIN